MTIKINDKKFIFFTFIYSFKTVILLKVDQGTEVICALAYDLPGNNNKEMLLHISGS